MPITHEQAKQIAERLARGRDIRGLTGMLSPTSETERAVPPAVPRTREWSAEAVAERVAFVEERIEIPHLAGRAERPDPKSLQGNIENYVGMAQVPVGLIGPLRINGLHAAGDYYVPLATTEGALVASYHRGARLITASGGAAALTTREHVQRAPGFVFGTMGEAALFAAWIVEPEQFDRFSEIVSGQTRHGRLLEVSVHMQANHVYVVLDYHTGDAAGQNMVTFCTAAVCEDILARTPHAPEYWFVESNMSGDKKATALSFHRTRGRNTTAEVVVPRPLVEKVLRTTPDRMADYWRISFVAGVQTGSIGVSGHVSNGLAAVFLATGQDVACIAEASVGVTRLEVTEDGDLYAAVNLPNLIVGTVGGGTKMPTARECLRIMDCDGTGTAARFAEICAVMVLGGELSIVGALCSGDFSRAHQQLGR